MWVMTILFVIMTLCWLITMSKYRKTNKNISKLCSDNRRLKMDIEGMNANHLAVYKESQKTKKKNTSNNKTGVSYMEGYLIEVNDGIYLVEKGYDAYEYWKNHGTLPASSFFSFTKNVFKASYYKDLKTAKEYAKKCGGRVLQHKPNLEVVD
ncbi:hypothetical protein [Staphylococcus hominis]